MLDDPQMMLADSKVIAVLAEAAHVHFAGDNHSARHPLSGLYRIVYLKTVGIGMLSRSLHGVGSEFQFRNKTWQTTCQDVNTF